MGLVRRRHFAVEGRKLLGIEDELFGEGHLGVGHDDGSRARWAHRSRATPRCSPRSSAAAPARSATSSPRSRPSRTRSSVPTRPACSSSRAARARARRWSRCTGPPTCCTPSASRSRTRACSSSAPTVSSSATSSACCRRSARPESSRSCSPISSPTSRSPARAAVAARSSQTLTRRVKGDARMSDVIDRAISDRERPLKDDLVVPFRSGFVRITAEESARIVRAAARRFRRHNTGRKHVEGEFFAALHGSWRGGGELTTVRAPPGAVERARDPRSRSSGCGRCSRLRELLHDLFGSRALLRLAGRNVLNDAEIDALFRHRSDDVERRALDRLRRRAARRRPRGARPGAAQERPHRGGRRDPNVRPHRRRRGAGPLADAAQDGRPSIAQRLAHRRRRPRPGHRPVGAVVVGRHHGTPAREAPVTRRRPVRRLPHPGADHAPRRSRHARRDAGPAARHVRCARAMRRQPW